MDDDKVPILDAEDFTIDFQDFGPATIPANVPTLGDQTNSSTEYKFTVESDHDNNDNLLLHEIEEPQNSGNNDSRTTSAFWSFAFYQQFFDVDDRMVLQRLFYSCIPNPASNYMDQLKPMPDFYGPFWVCVTLVFSIAISGNLADFFESLGADTNWEYDFKKVTISATIIFCYVIILPSLLSGYMWWRKSDSGVKLTDTLCLYGYSLTVLVPISILLCINYEWVRWILVLVAMATSGAMLTLTIWKLLVEEPRQIAVVITAVLAALHVGFILLFKLYFFTSSSTPSNTPSNSTAE